MTLAKKGSIISIRGHELTRHIPLVRTKPDEVTNALKHGQVILPLWGLPVIVSQKPVVDVPGLVRCRLIDDARKAGETPGINEKLRAELTKILSTSSAALVAGSGWVVPEDRLIREVLAKYPDGLWLGIPEPETEIDDLITLTGDAIALVVEDNNTGSGPTLIDLSTAPPLLLRKGTAPIMELENILATTLRLGPGVIFSILVVCTGNSCRSPLGAALIARSLSGLPVTIGSAGIAAPEGRPATDFAIAVAREMGLDITRHRARQLTRTMINTTDLILVMEPGHKEWITQQVPDAGVKVRLLGRNGEIPDPIGRSIEFYHQTALLIKTGVMRVEEEIKKRFT